MTTAPATHLIWGCLQVTRACSGYMRSPAMERPLGPPKSPPKLRRDQPSRRKTPDAPLKLAASLEEEDSGISLYWNWPVYDGGL